MRVVTAQQSEYVAAAQLLFQHLPGPATHSRIAATLQLLEQPGKPAARLLVARRGGTLVGASLAQVLPGATGMLWPPCAANGAAQRELIEDALLHEALGWLRRGEAKLAQVILAQEDLLLAAPLTRHGFTCPSKMHYLRRELCSNDASEGTRIDGEFETYQLADPAVFHDVLLRSYQGTLDFPELDGRRTLREILQGYQATGYDPRRWWLRHGVNAPVGALLLTEVEPHEIWELSYVGVVPEARRRGHGLALVRKALAEARSAGAKVLTVGVDVRNAPALALYRGRGFEEYDQRDVFLNVDLGTWNAESNSNAR